MGDDLGVGEAARRPAGDRGGVEVSGGGTGVSEGGGLGSGGGGVKASTSAAGGSGFAAPVSSFGVSARGGSRAGETLSFRREPRAGRPSPGDPPGFPVARSDVGCESEGGGEDAVERSCFAARTGETF
jgi:hypothetical protein